jgi:hypothetical protein
MATVASAGALFLFAAGWPSLTLAVKLEVAAPPVMAAARSVVLQPSARRMGMLRQRAAVHPETGAPQLSGKAPELDEAVTQAAAFRYSPVDPSLDGGTSHESESGAMDKMSRTPGNDPSVPTPAHSGPSWKKTAGAAAIGALGRVAAGRRDGDGGGDADDRTSKP